MTITRYVNTASTPGGDGTTNNTAGATRAFASLNEAMDSLPQWPSTLSDAVEIYCSGSAADTDVPVNLYVQTSSSNTLTIRGDNTTGKWNTSAYRLEATNFDCIYNQYASHVRLIDIQCHVTMATGSTTDRTCFRLATANNVVTPVDHKFERCIAWVEETGGAFGAWGFIDSNPGGSGGTCVRINCVAEGGYCGFGSDSTTWSTNNLTNYNCTAYGNEFNFMDTQKCINCIAASAGTICFNGTGTTGHSNNAASDTSAGGTSARDSQTFSFVDSANHDFHLLSTDAGARGFGLSDPGSGLYSTDIDVQTRSGSWDIGADQYVAAAIGATVRRFRSIEFPGIG